MVSTMRGERRDQGICSCTESREEQIFSWVFPLVFFQDMVIAENKHSDGDGHQPSCFGPVTLLQQHMGIKHPTRECCRREAGMWTVGSALSPARSTQGDEEEEEGNLEERGGREEQAKPARPFSWHLSLGAEAAWPVAWQDPQVLSQHHLP